MNISKNKWYELFFFDGAKIVLVILLVCLLISSWLGALTPHLIANLSSTYEDDKLFQSSLIFLLINFMGTYLNRVVYQLTVNKYIRLLIQYARRETYTRWIKHTEVNSEKYPQGEILSRIMSDTEAIRDLITSGSFGIFIDLCFVISCLFGFISLNKRTGFFISGSEIVLTVALLWGSRLMRDVFMKLRNSQAKVNRVTANVLGGFSQLYYTRHDRYASHKSNDAFSSFLEKQNEANNLDAAYYAIAESLYPILLAFIIFFFPYSGIVKPALIFAIVDLIQRSIGPIKEISGKIANIQRALTGIERIQNFLNDMSLKISTEVINAPGEIKRTKLKKFEVNIHNFIYPIQKNENKNNRTVFSLENINFSGKPGELIGIVGLSGSGKSTLLNILAGNLIAPHANVCLTMENSEGEFVLSINDLDIYRKEVSIVSQESHIFSESLIFNICLKANLSEYDRKHFQLAWEKFENEIPYLKALNLLCDDKIIPEKLSLGQKQLLAGIRACYLKKHIVLFDEISSALDSELEAALRACILLIQKFSLTIIVAHRVETIINSNEILVMDKGRLAGTGIHSKLLANSKVYQDFIQELSHS